jgi:predicted dehydrogenase
MGGRLRIGLVGTGFGKRVHLPGFAALADTVEVTAVCSARQSRAEEVAALFSIPFATDDYRDLVTAPDVDLVDICTPPDNHREIALAAIAAGKHVLCEKPMALTAEQARQMTECATAAGVVHAVNHEMRLTPTWRYLRDLVRDGYLGRLRFVSVTVHAPHGTDPSQEPYYWGWLSQADKGGGFLTGMLSHQIDLVRFAFGEITDVAGRTQTLVPERPVLTFDYRDGDPIGPDTPTSGTRLADANDTACLAGRLAGDAVLVVSGSWVLPYGRGTRVEAYGSHGMLLVDTEGTLSGARIGATEVARLTVPARYALPLVEAKHRLVPHFTAQAGLLAAAARDRAEVPNGSYATFADGLALQEIIDTVGPGMTAAGPPGTPSRSAAGAETGM